MSATGTLIQITPQEGNALSILSGVKRGTDTARATLKRLLSNGWLVSESVKLVAEAMVDEKGEEKLNPIEKGILQTYTRWAMRNRQYTLARRKKAQVLTIRRKQFGV
jgi:hypothetical protein